MKTASMICTYLYGSLSLIKGTIEGYIRLAKNILKGIDKIAAAALTTVRYTIDVSSLIKDVEKEYSTINLTVNNKIYTYGYNDKITVLRNGEEISIDACEFNESTDMLGIDE